MKFAYKTFPLWFLVLLVTSCANRMNAYCKLNEKYPNKTSIYRDFSLFGLGGIDKISCDSARKSKAFIFFMNYSQDRLDVIAKKLSTNRKFSYISRIRNTAKPLFVTNLLNPHEPTGSNYDTISIVSDSLFVIHRSFKARNPNYRSYSQYYIWKKVDENHIEFYHYSPARGEVFDINNLAKQGEVYRQISYKIQDGFLSVETRDDSAPVDKFTKKVERFDSYFYQVFLGSL